MGHNHAFWIFHSKTNIFIVHLTKCKFCWSGFEQTTLGYLDFLYCFLFSILFILALVFINHFLLLALDLVGSFLLAPYDIKLGCWSKISKQLFLAKNPPLGTTFAVSHKLWCARLSFSVVSSWFLISFLISFWLSCCLKGVVKFPHIREFSCFCYVINSSFMSLWLEKIFCMT